MYVCISETNLYLHAVLAQRRKVGRPAGIHNVWVSCGTYSLS